MKKYIALLLAAAMAASVFAGCGSAASSTASSAASSKAASSTASSAAASSSKAASSTADKSNKDLSILWSSGGNGQYVDYTVDYLKNTFGLNVNIEYNAKAHEIFQPELIAGNPPDIVMVQHSFFNYYEAIQAGSFQDVSSYLDLPVNGSTKTVREVANPDIIKSTSVDGATYLLCSNLNIKGIYYNVNMFKEHGWSVPKTWDEFLALCETIKTTTDIAPFSFPGKYPYYLDCFVFPTICTLGKGVDTYKDYNNMTKGFWTSDAVKQTAQRVQLMRDKGYFLDKLTSLTHTENQMEFLNGNVAMICCGSWLENEMADSVPDGFQMAFMDMPAGSKSTDTKYVVAVGNMFAFPAAAKNKEWTGEFLQTYYSDASAVRIAKDCGVVISPSIVASNKEVRAALKDSVAEAFESANNNVMLYSLASIWYKDFWSNYQNTLISLVNGDIDADEFCTTMEGYAQQVRDDSSIVKYKVD